MNSDVYISLFQVYKPLICRSALVLNQKCSYFWTIHLVDNNKYIFAKLTLLLSDYSKEEQHL